MKTIRILNKARSIPLWLTPAEGLFRNLVTCQLVKEISTFWK